MTKTKPEIFYERGFHKYYTGRIKGYVDKEWRHAGRWSQQCGMM
jgi:hypothetical protein